MRPTPSARCFLTFSVILATLVWVVSAVPVAGDTWPQPAPRHAAFVLHPGKSAIELSLFSGGARSKLLGSCGLFLGDPDVPVIAIPGMIGVSVDGVDLVAPDFEPDLPGVPEPMHLVLDPDVASIGAWNYFSGEIGFELHLIAPDGNLPVPQPVHLTGTLVDGVLSVAGDNGNIPDGTVAMQIHAFEVVLPPLPKEVWFSTEVGFGAGAISPSSTEIVPISDGDLLSRRGHVVRTNHELTRYLGIMPVVPDLGLDATVLGPRGQIWFSFEETFEQIWSETLGRWLRHGDLLSARGHVVLTNEQLLRRFGRMPPVSDAGLDAVARGPNRAILFSTEESFFSESLGVMVGHGDLLSHRGRIVRTNRQLLEAFPIIDLTLGPVPRDYGLDAVILRPHREIWFSTEVGFYVHAADGSGLWEWISDGDLLSTEGYVVARNLDIVEPFGPVEDVDNFGLDGASAVLPRLTADFDQDGDVDGDDLSHAVTCTSGADVEQADPSCVDVLMDDDNDVDQVDLTVVQTCASGEGIPGDPTCGTGPMILSWRSVREHGAAGELGLELDPAAAGAEVTCETRQGGVRKIVVELDLAVTDPAAGLVAVEDLGNGGQVGTGTVELAAEGTSLVITFGDGLPNGVCYRIDLADVLPDVTGDSDCDLRLLAGDTNGDGVTNLIDMAQIKSRNAADVTAAGQAVFDVNLDGAIDLIDMALVKSFNRDVANCP